MKQPIVLLLLLVAATFFTACANTSTKWPQSTTPAMPTQDSALVMLSFRPSALTETGKTKTENVETRINDISIYLVHKSTQKRSTYYLANGSSVLTASLAKGEYELYAIANWGHDMGGWSLENWMSLGAPSMGSEESLTYQGAMAMSVRQTFVLERAVTIEVPLKRAAAKATFDVSLAPAMVSGGGKIVSLQLFNCTGSIPLFRDAVPSMTMQPYSCYDVSDQYVTQVQKTYYLPENLQGSVSKVVSPSMRAEPYAPLRAAYLTVRVERNRKLIDYRIYLGENNTDDFNVRRNTHYFYDILIEGENPSDLRVSSVAVNFYGGLPSSGAGSYTLFDKIVWNSRVAYTELVVETANNAPSNVFLMSFRRLSGTFAPTWNMQYYVRGAPGYYQPWAENTEIPCHTSNGKSVCCIAFTNDGSLDNHTTDNLFEFTVRDQYGYAKSFTLQTHIGYF